MTGSVDDEDYYKRHGMQHEDAAKHITITG